MAQRTPPMQSILSIVPSVPVSDEMPAPLQARKSKDPSRRERRRAGKSKQPPAEQRKSAKSQSKRKPANQSNRQKEGQTSTSGNAQNGRFHQGSHQASPRPVQPVPTPSRPQLPTMTHESHERNGEAATKRLHSIQSTANPLNKRAVGDIKPYRPGIAPPTGSSGQSAAFSLGRKAGTRNTTPSKSRGLNSKSNALHPEPPKRKRSPSPLVYGTRMLILGVGIGVLAGTMLSVFDPASRYAGVPTNQMSLQATQSQDQLPGASQENSTTDPSGSGVWQLSEEISSLKTQMQSLAAESPDLIPSAFFLDLDTGKYVDLDAQTNFAAASTIKVPVLVAFFQDVDAGKIQLSEKLTMRPEQIAEGSGDMQFQPPGTEYTALETASLMITISDNTATNMLIDRLGGAEALNARFQSWGLTQTVIRNPLADLEGTNTTSAQDMARLMALVHQGQLVSLRSRDRLLGIMRDTVNDSLLPQGLGAGATIAHKTGDIGFVVGDVGLIDLPNGKRYLATAFVKRPHNDDRGSELIRQFSRLAYQEFNGSKSEQKQQESPFINNQ